MRRVFGDGTGQTKSGEAKHGINGGHDDTCFEMIAAARSEDKLLDSKRIDRALDPKRSRGLGGILHIFIAFIAHQARRMSAWEIGKRVTSSHVK